MQEALNKVFEIAYKVAEQENTIASYKKVLNNFSNAPESLQNKVIEKASTLLGKEFEKIVKDAMENLNMQTVTPLEKANLIATDLYSQGTTAEDNNDRAMLMIISYTFEQNKQLRNTTTYADFKSARKLEKIYKEIKSLRADIANLRETLLNSIKSVFVENKRNFDELKLMANKQNQLINELIEKNKFNFSWDKNINHWDNIKKLEAAAIPYFANAAINKLIIII